MDQEQGGLTWQSFTWRDGTTWVLLLACADAWCCTWCLLNKMCIMQVHWPYQEWQDALTWHPDLPKQGQVSCALAGSSKQQQQLLLQQLR
jgi:hypothetical protein